MQKKMFLRASTRNEFGASVQNPPPKLVKLFDRNLLIAEFLSNILLFISTF